MSSSPPNRNRAIPGRAHTDEKKREIVERILAAWMSPKAEHLRLGQLIANSGVAETFYVEDTELAELVENLVRKKP